MVAARVRQAKIDVAKRDRHTLFDQCTRIAARRFSQSELTMDIAQDIDPGLVRSTACGAGNNLAGRL